MTKGEWQFGIEQRGKEQLMFYINTDKAPEGAQGDGRPFGRRTAATNHKYELAAPLPGDWENKWHHVEACYDGRKMTVSIDNIQVAQMEAQGNIINAPFPVNIGRNEQTHGQDTRVYICDALMDNVVIADASGQLLNLDFETEQQEGTYFSYGIGARTYGTIWPDRTVQPEIWQMKKSAQPISCRLLSAANGTVEIWNRNHFLNTSYYDMKWELYEDGVCLQQGTLSPDIEPLAKKVITIPYSRPVLNPGCEYRLMITSSLKADEVWAKKGHVMAWDQLELPWRQLAIPSDKTIGKVVLTRTDDTATVPGVSASGATSALPGASASGAITVSGDGFSYSFTSDGQLFSIKQSGKELLKSPLQINVWRAPLALEVDGWDQWNIAYNNRKPWNGAQIANEFYSNNLNAITRIPISCEAFEADGQVYVNVRCFSQFGAPGSMPTSPACAIRVSPRSMSTASTATAPSPSIIFWSQRDRCPPSCLA